MASGCHSGWAWKNLWQRPCAHADITWSLPFERDARVRVAQGNQGDFTHRDQDLWAWDFDVPEGTPVSAAAPGLVVEVQDGFTEGAPSAELRERANVVVLDHGLGRFSIYQHLRAGSVRVREGDHVQTATVLAESGNTGFTTGPHLHFEVTDVFNRSAPVCFSDVPYGIPWAPRRFTSNAMAMRHLPEPPPPSPLPVDAFRRNGILLDTLVPARRWDMAKLELRGRTAWDARQVVAFVLPRAGGGAIREARATVESNGAFHVVMDLQGLDGPHGFAMAIPRADGSYASGFSVPVILRPPRNR